MGALDDRTSQMHGIEPRRVTRGRDLMSRDSANCTRGEAPQVKALWE